MELLPSWKKELDKVPTDLDSRTQRATYILPKVPSYYAERITYVNTESKTRDMVELALQRPLSHIGVHAFFKLDTSFGSLVNDARSIHPLILSLAMAEPRDRKKGSLYRFVVDLRKSKLIPFLDRLFRLPVCIVGYDLRKFFFCLWRLNLPEPRIVWDVMIHEKASNLGRHHPKYRSDAHNSDVVQRIRSKQEAKEYEQFEVSLEMTRLRYGIHHPIDDTDSMEASIHGHPSKKRFTREHILFASENAVTVAETYPHQVIAATSSGILHHLVDVEMPWTKTNARIQWNGIRIDTKKRDRTLRKCNRHLAKWQSTLNKYEIHALDSQEELRKLFEKSGILHLFKVNGQYSFEKSQLKKNQHAHPVVPLVLAILRLKDLVGSEIFTVDTGIDGRIHPTYHQLGTHTGRLTSQYPSILSLDSLLRPLIVPEEGRGIGEVDWSQIEVGIVAAVYRDNQLIEMFNSDDLYCAMAKEFYRRELKKRDLILSAEKFKAKHPKLRRNMKTCILGIINGMTAKGIADVLECNQKEAEKLYRRLGKAFPVLFQAMKESSAHSAVRGYASTATGLHRHRGKNDRVLSWEKRWLANHPIQGTAAAIFKATGNRLDKLYRQYDAWIIVPLHDAFVFEAPLEVLDDVADMTARVMCETVREFFPELKPRVEVNISNLECWNKDGDSNVLRDWTKEKQKTAVQL